MTVPPHSMSLDYVERVYADYLDDREDVPSEWREYFDKIEGNGSRVSKANATLRSKRLGPSFRPASIFNPPSSQAIAEAAAPLGQARLQETVDLLVRNYRVRGHIMAELDPLGRPAPRPVELDPAHYGFSEVDLDHPVSTSNLRGSNIQTLRQVISRLEETYCSSIGAQFMHIDDLEARDWLQRRWNSAQLLRIWLTSVTLTPHLPNRLGKLLLVSPIARSTWRNGEGDSWCQLPCGRPAVFSLDQIRSVSPVLTNSGATAFTWILRAA